MAEENRSIAGKFLPGGTSTGRQPGSRNRLQGAFLRALVEDFEKEGEAVIRIVRVEKPTEYLKIVASVLPKELLIPDNVLEEMTDTELMDAIGTVRRMKAACGPSLGETGSKPKVAQQ